MTKSNIDIVQIILAKYSKENKDIYRVFRDANSLHKVFFIQRRFNDIQKNKHGVSSINRKKLLLVNVIK